MAFSGDHTLLSTRVTIHSTCAFGWYNYVGNRSITESIGITLMHGRVLIASTVKALNKGHIISGSAVSGLPWSQMLSTTLNHILGCGLQHIEVSLAYPPPRSQMNYNRQRKKQRHSINYWVDLDKNFDHLCLCHKFWAWCSIDFIATVYLKQVLRPLWRLLISWT